MFKSNRYHRSTSLVSTRTESENDSGAVGNYPLADGIDKRRCFGTTKRNVAVRLDGVIVGQGRSAGGKPSATRDRIECVPIFVPVCNLSSIERYGTSGTGIYSLGGRRKREMRLVQLQHSHV